MTEQNVQPDYSQYVTGDQHEEVMDDGYDIDYTAVENDITFIPSLECWIRAKSIALFGSELTLNELIPKMTQHQVGELNTDISYYSKMSLGDVSEVCDEDMIQKVVHSIKCGNTTLKDFHNVSGECAYYRIDKAHGVVKTYLVSEGRDLTYNGSKLYDEDSEVQMQEFNELFRLGLDLVKDDTDNVLPKMINFALSGLCSWGLFSDLRFMNESLKSKWVDLVRGFTKDGVKSKLQTYQNRYTESESIVVPEIEHMTRLVTNIDFGTRESQKIPYVGRVKPQDFLNKLMESRSHATTNMGRSANEGFIASDVFHKLHQTFGAEMCVFTPCPEKFEVSTLCIKMEDVTSIYVNSTGELKSNPRCTLFMQNHQLDQSLRLRMINSLLKTKGAKVYWLCRYSDVQFMREGFLCVNFKQCHPMYDLVLIEFGATINAKRVPPKYVTKLKQTEGGLCYVPEEAKLPFLNIGQPFHVSNFMRAMVSNYQEHFELLLARDPQAMFSVGISPLSWKDNLELEYSRHVIPTVSITIDDSQLGIVYDDEEGVMNDEMMELMFAANL